MAHLELVDKPHIPWTIPTRFFKPLGSIESQALPKHEYSPKNMPDIAWNKGLGHHALDSYADANRWPLHSFSNGTNVAFPHNLTKAMRRGVRAEPASVVLLYSRLTPCCVCQYYAAISYVDSLVGSVIDTLEATGLASETVVTIMGDREYHIAPCDICARSGSVFSRTRWLQCRRIEFMVRALRWLCLPNCVYCVYCLYCDRSISSMILFNASGAR
jgi:hypothetical protein